MKKQRLLDQLKIDPDQIRIISVTGAGGKTSVIFTLAEELQAAGKRTAILTTTHMQHPEALRQAGIRVPGIFSEYLPEMPASPGLIIGRTQCRKGQPFKIGSPDERELEKLKKQYDCLLIEADGARKKPVKAYRAWEPVVLQESDLTIVVLGLSGLGQRICDTVCGEEEVCHILDKSSKEILTVSDYETLLTAENGLLSHLPGRTAVVLNQADTKLRRQAGEEILKRIHKEQACMADLRIYSGDCREYALILLAAGNSVRYGSNKLLDQIEGKELYRYALEAAAEIDAEKILVTQYPRISEAAKEAGFQVVINPHPEEGISGSMKLGLAAAGEKKGYLFLVCDQPGIRSWMLQDMLRLAKAEPERIIAAGTPDGQFANPNLFPRKFLEELQQITGDRGGKSVICNHPEEVTGYQISEAAARDLDVPEGQDR